MTWLILVPFLSLFAQVFWSGSNISTWLSVKGPSVRLGSDRKWRPDRRNTHRPGKPVLQQAQGHMWHCQNLWNVSACDVELLLVIWNCSNEMDKRDDRRGGREEQWKIEEKEFEEGEGNYRCRWGGRNKVEREKEECKWCSPERIFT